MVQLCESVNIMELLDTIRVGEQVVEFGEFLNVAEVLEDVVVNLQTLDHIFHLETKWIQLPDLVVIHIQLFELLEIL